MSLSIWWGLFAFAGLAWVYDLWWRRSHQAPLGQHRLAGHVVFNGLTASPPIPTLVLFDGRDFRHTTVSAVATQKSSGLRKGNKAIADGLLAFAPCTEADYRQSASIAVLDIVRIRRVFFPLLPASWPRLRKRTVLGGLIALTATSLFITAASQERPPVQKPATAPQSATLAQP